MDIGSIVGAVLGWLLVFIAIAMGGGSGFFNPPSILITVGGAIAATLIHYPLPQVMAVMKVARKALFVKEQDYMALYEQLTDYAVRARRDGLLALESDIEQISDPFMKKGFQMAVDGNSMEVLRSVLEDDLAAMQERHIVGQGIFKALGNYAPAFGMIGTLVGLVAMLQNMSDPKSLGSGMAVALLTTMYGAMVANLVALPTAGKLEQRTQEEVALKTMVIEGIAAIQEGHSPRIVEEKLRAFIPPIIRQKTIKD
ncbi:motility protein A [Pontiellaceae bacterium B1224]|nr:motility protein A [Pontiellaceae bacterium B1224]